MAIVRPPLCRIGGATFLVCAFIFAAGCAPSADTIKDDSSEIEVEGLVSVRGNEPFTALVLETADRNTYVIVSEDSEVRSEIQRRSPGRFRVSGVVYKGSWQGRDRAHLRVGRWERIDM
ncbi:MAG: hypothetical protein R3282_07920 [Rhodothermales bacterium]|nr:hypothetical protein [Rhodothermales bacterium]